MRVKIFKVLALLMLAALVIGTISCDRIGLSWPRSQKKQNVKNPQPVLPDPQKTDEPTVSETLPPLPPNKYGRENPFAPLVVASRPGPKPKPEPKPIETITVRLSALLGGTAIFVVDGANKSVSVNGEVAGMTVAEVKEDKVVLKRANKELITINVGDQIEVPKP